MSSSMTLAMCTAMPEGRSEAKVGCEEELGLSDGNIGDMCKQLCGTAADVQCILFQVLI